MGTYYLLTSHRLSIYNSNQLCEAELPSNRRGKIIREDGLRISAMPSDCVSLPYCFLMHLIFNKSSKTCPLSYYKRLLGSIIPQWAIFSIFYPHVLYTPSLMNHVCKEICDSSVAFLTINNNKHFVTLNTQIIDNVFPNRHAIE